MPPPEQLHDENEKARRQAETLAQKIEDPEMQRLTADFIGQLYTMIGGRIDRGLYGDVIPFPPPRKPAA